MECVFMDDFERSQSYQCLLMAVIQVDGHVSIINTCHICIKDPCASLANFSSSVIHKGKRHHGQFPGFRQFRLSIFRPVLDGCTLSIGRSGSALLQKVTFPSSSS